MLQRVAEQNQMQNANSWRPASSSSWTTSGSAPPLPATRPPKSSSRTKRLPSKPRSPPPQAEAPKAEEKSWNEAAQGGIDKGAGVASKGIRDGAEWLGDKLEKGAWATGNYGVAQHIKGFTGGLGELAGGVVDGAAQLISHR